MNDKIAGVFEEIDLTFDGRFCSYKKHLIRRFLKTYQYNFLDR